MQLSGLKTAVAIYISIQKYFKMYLGIFKCILCIDFKILSFILVFSNVGPHDQ